jgi:hypothetical protein
MDYIMEEIKKLVVRKIKRKKNRKRKIKGDRGVGPVLRGVYFCNLPPSRAPTQFSKTEKPSMRKIENTKI